MAKMIPVHYSATKSTADIACKPRNVYTVFATDDTAKVTCKRCQRMLWTKRSPLARPYDLRPVGQ
jgi:hypothetical protein